VSGELSHELKDHMGYLQKKIKNFARSFILTHKSIRFDFALTRWDIFKISEGQREGVRRNVIHGSHGKNEEQIFDLGIIIYYYKLLY
jgi:hypothetical protein